MSQMRLFLKLLFDIQWNNKGSAMMFLLIPVLIGMILQVGRYFVPVSLQDEQSFDSFSVQKLYTKNFKSSDTFEVFYTPVNEETKFLMQKSCDELRQSFVTYDWSGQKKYKKGFNPRGFDDEAALEETAVNQTNLLAGVVFKNVDVGNVDFSYKIRPRAEARTVTGLGRSTLGWLTANLIPTRSRLSPNGGVSSPFKSPYGDAPYYYKEGFLTLQHYLNEHFIDLVAEARNITNDDFKSQNHVLNRFPEEKGLNDPLAGILEQHLSFIILLAFCYLGQQVVKRIANDKESRLKEYMLMMKLGRDTLWRSYFLFYAILALLSSFAFTVTIFLPISGNAVVTFSSFSVIFVFCFLYCCSLITLSFLTTVFFSTGSAASAASTTIVFFLFIPYSFIAMNKAKVFTPLVKLLSFSSPVAMSVGCSIIASKEVDGVGVTWENLADPVSLVDNDSMKNAFFMLIFDTILYYLLARYLDMVYPGKYGIAKPWNYFSKIKSKASEILAKPEGQPKSSGIVVENVEKTFAISNFGIRKALDDVSFKCPQDQVTVLLGPNGAGKSTLMNIMCGTIKSDAGSVEIDGFSMENEPEQARRSLGMCPQFDIVIEGLTPLQHLLFFAQLKGSGKTDAVEESESLLAKMKLESKTNTAVEDLSGGMRRKLSLAIALCGGSKAIVLDEPSSGLDVVSRSEIWDIISSYSSGKTILLSTHYTDEAEALADNIVVMAQGKVLRAESVSQLKCSTRSGFLLSISLLNPTSADAFASWLKEFQPESKIMEQSGTQLSVLLPKTLNPKVFFSELETRKTALGVSSFAINDEGLEQTFIKILNENAHENFFLKKSRKISEDEESVKLLVDPFLKPSLTGVSLWWGQIVGCLMKNFFHWKKNWKIFLCELLVPALMTFISIRQIVSAPEGRFSPEVRFDIGEYSRRGIAQVSSFSWNSIKKETEEHILALNPKTLAFGLSTFDGSKREVIGWFNPQMYHSAPAALEQVSNFLIGEMLNETRSDFIQASNHPLPMAETILSEHAKNDFNLQAMTLVYNLIIGVMVMFSAFSLLPVREKKCGMNVLQTCAGVSQKIRWIAQYFWDLTTCIPSISLVLVILLACRGMDVIQAFVDHMDVLIAIFGLFSFAQLPMVYLSSFHVKDPASSICFNVNLSVVFTMCTFLSVTLVRQFDTFEKAEMINSWFLWFPPHCFAMSIFDLYFNAQMGKTCENKGFQKLCDYGILPYVKNPYSFENGGVGKYLVAFGCQIACFWTVLMILQIFDEIDVQTILKRGLAKIFRRKQRRELEDEKLNNCGAKLVVDDLHKNYGKFKALKGINFDVQPGECVGLLGANGAGKSTTFKILTGQIQPNIGSAHVDGFDVSTQKSRALEKLGYCPQYDAILKQLSPNEVLRIFARLRGVEAKLINPLVRSLIELLEISDYSDQSLSELSGGTRRKVSVALTIIGDSQTIILDEPSCGLDPKSRKELRNVIKTLLEKGKSVLLSSHSMEECAALCERMCILNKGSLAYFGKQQNLKDHFSRHLHVVVEINEESRSKVFAGLKEIDQNMTYSTAGSNMIRALIDKNVPLSQLFGFLESAQTEKLLTSYTVRETALEDIFHEIENSESAITEAV